MKRKVNDLIRYGSSKSGFDLNFLIKNSSWMLFNNIITVLVGVGISVIFARIATQEVFGLYSFLISILALLSILSMPGMNTAMFRGVSKGFDGTYKKGARFMFFSSTIGLPILLGIGIYHYYFVSEILGLCFMFSSILFPLYYPPKVWINLLQAQEKFREFAIYNSILSIIRLIIVASVIFISKGSLLPIFMSFILVDVSLNSFYFIKTLKFVRNDKVEEGWKSTGYKMLIPALFYQSYAHIDKVVLMSFFGAEKLAIYSIAAGTVTMVSGLLGGIVRVYSPKIYRTNTNDLVHVMKKRLVLIFFVSSLGLIILYLLLPFIIEILYSTKYSDSIVYAQAYLLMIPFYFLVSMSGGILFKDKKENFYSFSLVISGIVNVSLYVILIPSIGMMGGVIGSIAFFAIQAVMNWSYILTKLRGASNA